MKHIDLHTEMTGLLEGALSPEHASACKAHLALCAECSEAYEQLLEAEHLIGELLTIAVARCSTPDAAVDRALARCRALMQSPSRLAGLQALLAPLCGHRAAAHILSTCENAGDLEWNGFVARVASQVRRICGETSAQLVLEAVSI